MSARILLLTGLFLAAGAPADPLHSQSYTAGTLPSGTLWGSVVDAQTGDPLPATRVRVLELGRTELSHADGGFHFGRIAPGRYTVAAQRVGYAPVQMAVEVRASDTTRVTLRLVPSAIELAGIVVTGTGRERTAGEAYRPTSSLEGAALRRQLGASVAATLQDEPGIAQRYNGPAAAQPVIRGLSGDRVLMLEDGQRTGDVASTASDHAVTIEPLTAERIEVVRGPAGLLYGSNALGGVVNVIREEVPRTLPEAVSGTASAQLESMNAGMTAGASVLGAAGPLALRAELSGRRAGDTRTPLGTLPSTQLEGHNVALGGSWVHDSGFAGASLRDYQLRYGVPGTFNGVTIPGAHEGGVTIDLQRTTGRGQAAWLRSLGPFRSVELDGTYVRFEQTEFEPGGFVGTRFGQITGTANLMVRHSHELHDHGLRSEGAFGFWGMGRDFSVAGASTGSRPAQQVALAGFAYEELDLGPARLELGARYDWTRITPLDTRPGGLGSVRARDFGAVSGSVAGTFEILPGWLAGASVARAFRTPSIEELFSDGPHLADYSFNIGNPDLDSEFGLGADLFVRATLPRFHAEGGVFRNSIRNYIYYAPTGELDPRFRRFPVFQASADDAVLVGAEGRFQWELRQGLVLGGSTSYVRGTRAGGGEPLPSIPPLQGALNARYEGRRWFFGAGWHLAHEQVRVPFAPETGDTGGVEARCYSDRGRAYLECPTPGYAYGNLTAGLRWTAAHRLHTLTLNVENVTDTVWHDHLSRIKDVAPQPGRNVQLLYRVNF